MKGRALLAIMLLVAGGMVLAAGCSGEPETATENGDLQGKVFISGAFALYPMMITWSEEFHKVHPGVTFEISAGGAGKGMTDALSDMVDIGMVSRSIYPEEEEKGAVWVAVTKDAVVGTVNADNPYLDELRARGVTGADLEAIYVDESVTSWGAMLGMTGAGEKIQVYTRSDACGAATIWAEYMGYNQEDLKGVGVYGDPGLADAVRADTLGIGYNNVNYAYDAATGLPIDGIAIIPLDLDGNGQVDPAEEFYGTRDELTAAIASGAYPSPPARELNLVTKDRFTGVTAEFVRWILTDGQSYALENGYIPLTEDKVQAGLAKLG